MRRTPRPRTAGPTTRWSRAVGLLVLSTVVGCAGSPAPAPPATPRVDAPRWVACDLGDCASVTVPVDHDEPGGPTIDLALARVPATEHPRLGTLFVNPGGPGASGREYVGWFAREGLEQYDLVGWDPRGVDASGAVVCLDGAEADAHLALDQSPDTPDERAALAASARRFAEACEANAGDLLAHLSRVDVARDLDLLRAAVGDERLTFYGASYGTAIGATYAQLFPERVGRLVLDAAADLPPPDSLPQAVGFDRALGRFAAWCAAQSCALGEAPDAVVGVVTGLLDGLDARGLRVGDRMLTQSLAAMGAAAYLYGGSGSWPFLARAVERALDGDGEALLAASDELTGRRPDGGYSGLLGAFTATWCADAPRMTLDEADAVWARDRELAPVFGYHLGPAYGCVDWPAPLGPQVQGDAAGAPAVVVIGGENDPATPYEWSVELAGTLASGVLVSWSGEGHAAYGGRSACIDRVVRAYLVDGDVPAAGTRCA